MKAQSFLPVSHERNVARSEQNPFTTLQRQIDSLFDDFSRGFPALRNWAGADLTPTIDVSETDKEIEITAELPGLEEKDVQVNVADNVLTIKGEKKAETEQKDKNYRLVERSYGAFSRTLALPEGVNTDAIKAKIAKGLLTVTIPKPAPAQVKKIDVKAAA
jgi:HSP20 family protein